MNIKDELIKLSEDDLRKKIVIPLMEAFGARKVRDWHKPREKGKDVLYEKQNDFEEWVLKAIVLKAKQINVSVWETEVCPQVTKSAGFSINDMSYPVDKVKPRGIIIMTSREITDDVLEIIEEFAGKTFPATETIDGKDLSDLIEGRIKNYNECSDRPDDVYDFQVDTFKEFCERYRKLKYQAIVKSTNSEGEASKPLEGGELK